MDLFSLLIVVALVLGTATVSVSGLAREPPYAAETTPVEYFDDFDEDAPASLLGHLAVPEGEGPFPAVIIIPDWNGVDDYEQIRATMVAKEWGFVGFAADIYAVTPQSVDETDKRIELANLYRGTPELFASRINAAIETVNAMDNVDTGNVVLFGYCFGGTGVLQYGLYGYEDAKAVVSFHGGFGFLDFPEGPEVFKPKVLVLSGGDDNTAKEITDMEKLLDSAQAPWEITRYAGIEHAFTVWSDDRYDEFVDKQSWESARSFIVEAFGIVPHETAVPDEPSVVPVDYAGSIDGLELRGYLALPDETWERPLPAVVIVPDWDGVNTYEQERATALAELGYVAMAADVFGAEKQTIPDMSERVEQVMKYTSDPGLLNARMQDAIAQVKMVEGVDPNEIGVIGYCFGGSAVVQYSLMDGSDAKVAVAFHGSFGALEVPSVDSVDPYLLLLSGGDDPQFGNQTATELAFDAGDASWEITRYAGLGHGFSSPTSADYQLTGDARSWASMLATFGEYLPVPQKKADVPDEPGVPADTPGEEGVAADDSGAVATPEPTSAPQKDADVLDEPDVPADTPGGKGAAADDSGAVAMHDLTSVVLALVVGVTAFMF